MNYQSLMQRAISLASEVKSSGDVPVGALIVNEVGENNGQLVILNPSYEIII